MVWQDLAAALALVFVIEGVMPFLSPRHWRQLVSAMSQLDDRSMRIMGLISMAIGLALLALIK
jgi:uncharacterized protein YjeT (DUF2065 family)